MNDDKATWLPNLVGGVSIWKLGIDLNEPKFMGGRLLVPETEGSEGLPVRVAWDLTGLTPLSEALAKWPGDVAAATEDFKACLERVAKVFATPNSGFDKFKDAFTVPAFEADGGAHYYFSAAQKKLLVINWGASPRSMGGKADYVFGYETWGRAFKGKGAAVAGAAGAAAVGAAVGGAAVAAATGDPEKDAKKETDEKKRPWWIWPLFALIAIALVLLALLLLRGCENTKAGPDAAADALAEAATDGAAEAAADAEAEAAAEGGADATAEAAADAAAEAAADAAAEAAADASADAATDGGKDGGKDGGEAAGGGGDGDEDDGSSGGGGSGGSGGGSAGGGKVTVTKGPGGGAKTSVHRRHYHDGAAAWRVATGHEKVSRTEQQENGRYDVWLSPGKSFEGVRVEWQDKTGKWHAH